MKYFYRLTLFVALTLVALNTPAVALDVFTGVYYEEVLQRQNNYTDKGCDTYLVRNEPTGLFCEEYSGFPPCTGCNGIGGDAFAWYGDAVPGINQFEETGMRKVHFVAIVNGDQVIEVLTEGKQLYSGEPYSEHDLMYPWWDVPGAYLPQFNVGLSILKEFIPGVGSGSRSEDTEVARNNSTYYQMLEQEYNAISWQVDSSDEGNWMKLFKLAGRILGDQSSGGLARQDLDFWYPFLITCIIAHHSWDHRGDPNFLSDNDLPQWCLVGENCRPDFVNEILANTLWIGPLPVRVEDEGASSFGTLKSRFGGHD